MCPDEPEAVLLIGCPDDNTIAELVCRRLEPEAEVRVEAHLADCRTCRRLVGALAAASPPRLGASALGTEPMVRRRVSTLLRPGALVGRYCVLEAIGAGAMGVVYRAHDPELARDVALKLLHPDLSSLPGAPEQLIAEARAMARLRHQHVVAVFDAGVHGEHVFVAMELVEGRTLRDWLAEPHSWREAVRVVAAAARGLAAAHAIGIVHRDLKPENILVGADGEVRVSDFGLARSAGTAADIAGTPRYMAPEQRDGVPPDPSADQYSLCVVLGEALPANAPARVRRIARRGLRAQPGDRYSGVDVLAGALDRTLRRRWPWVAGTAAAVAATVAIVALAARPAVTAEDTCSAAAEHVAEVWPGSAVHACAVSFARSNLPFAAAAWSGVRRALDDYAERWRVAHTAACVAGRRGEHSDAVLDRRMQCLDHRLDDLRALATAFAAADEHTVARAVRAAESLPPVERCLDLDVVLGRVPPPAPEVRADVETVYAELAAARAQLATGHHERAIAPLEPITERARALAHAPLLAEALLTLGHALTERARNDGTAQAALDEAARVAYAAGDDELAAQAWIALVFAAGDLAADATAGESAAALARAALDRVPRIGPIWRARLASYEGVLLHARADYRGALARHTDALAAARAARGSTREEIATFHNNLALTLQRLGRGDEALAHMREAVAIRARALGADHPITAENRGNLATHLAAAGRDTEALAEFDVAIAVLERHRATPPRSASTQRRRALVKPSDAIARGSSGAVEATRGAMAADGLAASTSTEHPLLATVLTNSCLSLERTGRIADALARARRALAIFERNAGPDHPATATATAQVARLLAATKSFDEATRLYERALAIQERRLGPEHPDLAATLDNLAWSHIDAGRPRRAIPPFERDLAIVEKVFGASHRRVAAPVIGLGQAHLETNSPARAVPLLRRGLDVLVATNAPRAQLAEARFLLARAQWDSADRQTALATAAGAREDYASLDDATGRARIDAWLRERRR